MLYVGGKVRCFSNNKSWINKDIKALLNRKRIFMAKGDLRRAKDRYRNRLEGQLEQNSANEIWNGIKSITAKATRSSHRGRSATC